jgi:hypothetical protein
MEDDRFANALAAWRRRLRALAALAADPGATPAERANAASLRKQLEERLRKAGAPAGDWTDQVFRLGRRVKSMRNAGPVKPGDGDFSDYARRLGKMFGRSYRKWFSD